MSRTDAADRRERLVDELQAMHERLLAFAHRHAGRLLLRFEPPEDLVQGIHHEALRAADRLEVRSTEELRSWILTIARRHLSDRREYWLTLKRDGGRALRLSSDGRPADAPRDLADERTGPGSFAANRESLVMAARAIALLMPRDRELVRWAADDVPIAEQAERLGVSYEAAARARTRALERLQKTFELVRRRAGRVS